MLFCIRKPKVGKNISATFYGFYFLFHCCFQRRVGATRIVDILYISVDLIKRSTRKDCHTGLTPDRDSMAELLRRSENPLFEFNHARTEATRFRDAEPSR